MHVDAFCVYTDNETWAGRIQPVQALRDYRSKFNKKDAKLIVCGTTTTKFTIADPSDPGMLDIVGFDSAAPQLITDFVR
jgi:60 kDa SS-A/Ro ribonucleoprotein